jgi:chorismate mutase
MLPELEELREKIDAVDRKIFELVCERVNLVLRVGEIKRERGMQVYDPKRERLILDRLAQMAQPPIQPGTVRRIFERLIDEARSLEQQHVGETKPKS